ncbi:MAG: STAS domain-containing protein [Casimicrobiaceae bacterium]
MLTQLCPAAASDAPAESGFVLSDDGGAWRFRGTLTFDDVSAVFAASRSMGLPTTGVVDMSGLMHADSSALAVFLALSRRATAEDRPLSLAALPEALLALARVYGIDELLAPTASTGNGVGS